MKYKELQEVLEVGYDVRISGSGDFVKATAIMQFEWEDYVDKVEGDVKTDISSALKSLNSKIKAIHG